MDYTDQKAYTFSNSLPSKICDNFIFFFALWTIASHATVTYGGSLMNLIFTFILAGVLLLSWCRIRNKRKQYAPTAQLSAPSYVSANKEQLSQITLIWILVVLAVFLTLTAHRPDADDARYVNRAVAAADAPHEPILQYDTRHSIPGIPINETSKLISNEMLVGALSLVTGLPAIYLFHLVLAPFAAMLAILAFGQLFRMLAPKFWAYGVLATVVFLFANGEVHRTFGNFSFVRLHQGKGILVTLIVPLLITYGLRFAGRPTTRHWLLLTGVQIAAIGVNTTGLMLGPIIAQLAVFTSVLGMNLAIGTKRLLLGLTASIYPLVLGLYIKFGLLRYYAYVSRQPTSTKTALSVPQHDASFFFRHAEYVFGDGLFAFACLAIILTAWVWGETRLSRKLCLVFTLVVGLFFANPLFANLVNKYITGTPVFWRIFWLIPLPLMAGITLLAPLSAPIFSKQPLKWRKGLFCLLLIAVLLISEQSIFSEGNYVRMGLPGLKVTPEYTIAHALTNDLSDRQTALSPTDNTEALVLNTGQKSLVLDDHTNPFSLGAPPITSATLDRPNVLVPESVSIWLPTIHRHPYPLVSRLQYRYKLGQQKQERVMLKRYIMGDARPAYAPKVLSLGIKRYRIAGVCIPLKNKWIEEIREVLQKERFKKRRLLLSHEIWMFEAESN